jgi:hypothetical protein
LFGSCSWDACSASSFQRSVFFSTGGPSFAFRERAFLRIEVSCRPITLGGRRSCRVQRNFKNSRFTGSSPL